MRSAPLRFLLATLVLGVGVRAAILVPGVGSDAPAPPGRPAAPSRLALATPAETAAPGGAPASPRLAIRALPFATAPVRQGRIATDSHAVPAAPSDHAAIQMQNGPAVPATPILASSPYPPVPPARSAASANRWSLSTWLLVRREEGGAALAPGGTLGGSQAGARLTFALGGGVALGARAYLPLRRPAGAEMAAGLDWRPVDAVPVNLLAERRQRLGRDGRNAFALTAYGGASRNLTPRLRLEVYGQAGVVGLRSRDLFADGSVRLARRVGPVALGAGAWGAAQPGAARLDAGPSLSWRLPVRDSNLRLQADWRFRVAGDAAPRSGPALTLSADF